MLRSELPGDLMPFEPDFHCIVREGLALFTSRFGSVRAGMTTRSERSNIHDCMREIAQRLFPNNWEQRGNLFLLRIGIYRIKLKKFDASLSSSSYLTQAVFDFLSQTYQTLFEKDVINLQLGYIPLGPSLSDYPIWIMMPKGLGATAWQCELRQSTAVELRPIPPATNPNVPAKPRVTLKPSKQRKGEQGKDE